MTARDPFTQRKIDEFASDLHGLSQDYDRFVKMLTAQMVRNEFGPKPNPEPTPWRVRRVTEGSQFGFPGWIGRTLLKLWDEFGLDSPRHQRHPTDNEPIIIEVDPKDVITPEEWYGDD